MALDSASNGNFNTRSCGEAEALIENLASSNSTKNADFDRRKAAGNIDGKLAIELKNKLDSVHNILVSKKSVQFANEVEIFEPANTCDEEDVNFIGRTGFQGQRFGNIQNRSGYNNFGQRNPSQGSNSFTKTNGSSTYQAPPAQPNQYEVKAMLEQVLEGQQNIAVNLNGRMDAMYNDLNGKVEALSTHVKKLDTQVAQTASAVKRQDGILPGQTDTNPRYSCNTIVLNGDISAEEFEQITETFLFNLSEEETEQLGSSDQLQDRPIQNQVHPISPQARPIHPIQKQDRPTQKSDRPIGPQDRPIDIHDRPIHPIQNEDRPIHQNNRPISPLDRPIHPTQNQDRPIQNQDRPISIQDRPISSTRTAKRISKEPVDRVYKPTPPHSRVSNTYDALVDKISWQFPEVHEFRDLPRVKKVIDKAYAGEISLNDAVDLIHHECAPILISRLPEKLPDPGNITTPPLRKLPKVVDPGRFVVPCSISGVAFKESLVDSGSYVNVISRAIAEKLGIRIRSTEATVTFATDDTAVPCGTILDLFIKVGGCLVPTDFVAVEMSEHSATRLILGRPFMATVGAIMDMPNKRISFSYIDKEVFYKAIPRARASNHISCITVVEENTRHGLIATAKAEKKMTSTRVKNATHMTLTPQKRVGDTIEYKIKCKGMSKPFSKVKALITPEFKAQGQAAIDGALSEMLTLNVHKHRMRGPHLKPPPLPDPSRDSHRL